VIGNPCYRYNKYVKETFFKNVYLSYMFLQYVAYGSKNTLDRYLPHKATLKVPIDQIVHQEAPEKNHVFLYIVSDFIQLALKTIENNKHTHVVLYNKIKKMQHILNKWS
jgi:hypothetical protein